jgi:hypothetical protein
MCYFMLASAGGRGPPRTSSLEPDEPRMLNRRPPPLVRVLRHPLWKSHAFIGAVSAIVPGGSMLAYSHFVETRWLKIATHRVPLAGLARATRLLHLSDLHLVREDRWVRGMIDRLSAIACDVAVITGDLVMPDFDPAAVRALLRALPHPPGGLYFAPGNWEYWAGMSGAEIEALAEDTGMTLLLHRAVSMPEGYTLAGIDDELAGHPDVDRLFAVMPAERPAVVLSHCPSLFPRLDRGPVRLVLSGHTHGGQIRLPGLGAPWLPNGSGPYDMGWFGGGVARLFVNRGFGTSMARLRFLCRPEAVVLELEPADG